LIFFVFRLLVS